MPRLQLPEKLAPIGPDGKPGGLLAPNRYKVICGGRGKGASWGIASALVHRATIKPIRVLCARETQKSIDESVHRVLKDTIERLEVASLFDVQKTHIFGRNGSEFAFAGVRQQSITNLKSYEGFDVCWVAEGQFVTKYSWDVLIPTIRAPGSEIWIDLNPELDTDETYQRFVADPPPGAFVQFMSWRDNPWFPAELEAERRLMKRRDPVGYENVWEGKCRPAVDGAIYAQEIDALLRNRRVTVVEHDAMLPVDTVWDLGYNDQTVIALVQRVASEIRVIEVLVRRFTTYDQDITELRQRPYLWGTDWLPHDARHRLKAADGKSAEAIVRGMGRNVRIVERADLEDGIKVARGLFRHLWVDKEKCADWLNSLKRYRRHKSRDGAKTGAPEHDDASHGADVLRYLAQVAGQIQTSAVHNAAASRPYSAAWVT